MRKRHTIDSSPKPRLRDVSLKTIAPRVLKLARPYTKTLALGFLALAVASGINLLFPFLIGQALNDELSLSIKENLGLLGSGLVVLFALQAVFFYIRHYCFYVAGHQVVAKLRQSLFESIVHKDIAFFDKSKSGDLLSRLSSDTQLVQRAVTVNISIAVRYVIQVIGGIILMLVISPKLTLVIIVLIPVIVLGSMFWGKKLRTLSRTMQNKLGDASVVAEESLISVRTVRVFTGEDHETSRYNHSINESLAAAVERTKVAAIFSSAMVFLLHSSIAVIFCFGASMILKAELSIGDLTAFTLYGTIVAVSFAFLAGSWDEFMQAVGASERIFEITDAANSVIPPQSPKNIPEVTAGEVIFDAVTFSYPSRESLDVLKDISFSIRAGETVALVGPSGGGKSTIASLIPRFYDPQKGVISYCGIPLPELHPMELRNQLSLVPQDPQVFSVSVFENIQYGKRDASMAEVKAAAQAANIDKFIESLPEGYDTLVGDRGVLLSGGERQRIAIARAILKNPKFLILDEATSSLDSENEALVQQALERLMEGRSTLIIAHRLSTVQHADNVLVIKDGQISQSGTHQSLIDMGGLYRTLVEHQLL